MRIEHGRLDDPRVRDLLRLHLAGMHAHSPPGQMFALDLSGLQAPGIAFLTAWEGETLLGCGALKALGEDAGEVKSMRVPPEHLRKGVGAAILRSIVDLARSRGYRSLHLETGTGPAFAPAHALYRRFGFIDVDAFGDYQRSDFNVFMMLRL